MDLSNFLDEQVWVNSQILTSFWNKNMMLISLKVWMAFEFIQKLHDRMC